LRILESHGIVFHLILGNELFTYPDPVGLVEALRPFWGRYAIYSTFPPGYAKRYLDPCIEAGLYNISGGVDVPAGMKTGDRHVDRKSSEVLYWLDYCHTHGVPDVQATVTIHRHNYDKLEPLLDYCTERDIWVGCSLVEASPDGKHDFYGSVDSMRDWLIPENERGRFRSAMSRLASQVSSGRWKMQVPPSYFEEMGEREVDRDPWHCSLPLLIHVEEDGVLRACSYRGGLDERYTVFDLREGGSLSMSRYIEMQQRKTRQCPGCGVGGGAWSYWYMAEEWQKGLVELGDQVFQRHVPGYEFERTRQK
jgi:MoaA/NifB/PqqE/SkfB family radical SAM enzyme